MCSSRPLYAIGCPERAVRLIATSDDWIWLVTEQILQEYIDVLKRPKFHLSQETIDAWAELLALHSVKLETPSMFPDFPRDPKDAPSWPRPPAVQRTS